ncbi:MAG: S8 family serine peptidase [Bdellovibrionia bacterium]
MKRSILIAIVALSLAGCLDDRTILVQAPSSGLAPAPVAPSVSDGAADPLVENQWTVKKLGLDEVWKQPTNAGTRRVTVALLGTGVDYNHEDLRANIFVNQAEAQMKKPGLTTPVDGVDDDGNGFIDDVIGWDAIDNSGFAFDRSGSGTAAAGIIGASHSNGKGIRGINSNVSMIPVRYIDRNGYSTIPNLVKALRYVVAVRPDVVFLHLGSMEFGFGSAGENKTVVAKAEDAALSAAMADLLKNNIPVVLSAGNAAAGSEKAKSVIRRLSAFENVFVVTSTDETDRRPFIANYGMDVVDTAAPGEEVLTTLPNNQYGKESGTFSAAAHVTGALALALSKFYGRVNYRQLYSALLSEKGSDRIPGLEMEVNGGNRLNILKLLTALENGLR